MSGGAIPTNALISFRPETSLWPSGLSGWSLINYFSFNFSFFNDEILKMGPERRGLPGG
jgi:hypothetical protein